MTPSAVAKLVAKWRERKALDYISSLVEAAKTQCADELEVLATAPPEQATKDSLARKGPSPELGNADERGHPSPTRPGERSTGQKPDRSSPESLPPQPASDGALATPQAEALVKELVEVALKTDHDKLSRNWQVWAINAIANALASHDQKVRGETLAEMAPLIMEHRYIRDGGSSQCRCAKIVFHGQSWDDDFKSWWEHIRSLAGAVGHQHTTACYSKVPETEGKGDYLSCGKVAGDKGK